jgi:N-acetylmuramoyl-L-alanine amidase
MNQEEKDLLSNLPQHSILALTAYLEARNQPVQGIVGVMYSILNRVKIGKRGKTISEVCLSPYQYSCWNNNDINKIRGLRIANKLATGTPLNDDSDIIVFQVCLFLAARITSRMGIRGEEVRDPTNGATHYYNPAAVTHEPEWAKSETGAVKTIKIADHVFFKDVAM